MLESAPAARNFEGRWSAVGLRGDRFLVTPSKRADDFPSRLLAAAAAIGDGKMSLYFVEGGGASSDDLAKLAISDGVADANVHGARVRFQWMSASEYK